MATCPKCQNEILDDFGLVMCGNCGASLFVGIDGSIQEPSREEETKTDNRKIEVDQVEPIETMGMAAQEFVEPRPEKAVELDKSVVHFPDLNDLNKNATSSEDADATQVINSIDNSMEYVADTDPVIDTANYQEQDFPGSMSLEAEDSQLEENVMGFNIDDSQPDPLEAAQEYNSEDELSVENQGEYEDYSGSPESADEQYSEMFENQSDIVSDNYSSTEDTMGEVEEFGNSELSGASDGIYIYTLRIDGIDSGDIKNHIYQAISNPRLVLDADEIISTLKNGHLTIRELSPVKAFVILNDIKGLPIDVFWEQRDITS